MPYIGTSPSQGVRRVHTYTATANQTSFSGAGAEGATLSYKDSNFVDVYQNGVKLGDADYTATSGTAIVLGTGATVSDLVVVVAYDVFSAADTVSKADGGQFDGNVTMAGTLGVTGAVTANAGVVVDNITIDGTEIDLSSGDLTIDVAGDIILDADGADIKLLNDGTHWGSLYTNATPANLYLQNMVSDGDIYLSGSDGGSAVNALILDMSDAGTASFNHDVKLVDNGKAIFGTGGDLEIYHDGSNSYIADEGTGGIIMSGGTLTFQNQARDETYATMTVNSSVDLYHNNVKKFETTSTGIDITGNQSNFTASSVNAPSGGNGILDLVCATARSSGFGPYIAFHVPNSTGSTTTEDMGVIGFIAPDSTNGSRKADFIVNTRNTSFAERMRILANGVCLFGKSADDNTSAGATLSTGGNGFVRSGAGVASFNRTSNDGTVINIQQDATSEGSISVSGTTVSYNGGHLARWSQLTDGSKDTSIVKGTVMTNLDQMAVWSHNAVEEQDAVVADDGYVVSRAVDAKEAYTEDNEQLNCMAVSSVEGDANVAGVFVNWDNDDDFNDMNVAMTGDMVIRIAKGTTVTRGDLLMSAGDGTAKPQGDDIVRSKTIAKVTSINKSHTYDDGTYLVPCVLMAC